MIEGVVIKGVASRFTTDTEEGIKECFARGKLKKDGDIRVGDRVIIERENKDFVITKVIERKKPADKTLRCERRFMFYRDSARARARLYACR